MRRVPAKDVVADIALCIGFFTRLPVRHPDAPRSFAAALWAAPVAGLLIGLIVGLFLLAALAMGLRPKIAAALALAAGMLATGALHEDGLADVADGFGGGRDREGKLAIMRDSRIGTYGVVALAVSLLLRWSALVAIAATPAFLALSLCVAAHSASRALLPAFLHFVPPARSDGLGSGVGHVIATTMYSALLIGLVALLPLGLVRWAVCALALALLFLFLRNVSRRQIGGQTGDVLGALQQGAECIVLILASTVPAASA